MEINYTLADIWNEFKKGSDTKQGTLDDNSNEVILGPRFNTAIHDWANGYLKTLKIGPEHKAMDERAKLLDLHWGHIEHDGALLLGVGAAMTNFATVLATNVDELAKRWQGDSFDAFKTAIDKVQKTIAEYGAAATTTGTSLVDAMGQIREMYQTFAEDSVRTHLHFEVSPPKQWHKMPSKGYTAQELVEACPSSHATVDCMKLHSEQLSYLANHWVTERRWEICKNDPCESDAGRTIIMFKDMVDECQKAIDHIKGKLNNFYGAVKTVTDGVSGLYDVALGNVHNLAKAEVFGSLRVIGGQPAGGPPPTGGGSYPMDSGSDVGYPTGGGGGPVPSGDPGMTDPGPVDVAEPPQPEPVEAPAVTQTPPADTATAPESVQIQDGDHTIGVTSPDGEGRVRVTVEDAAGQTKTYDLDFNAASGMPSTQPAPTADGATAEQIPARTDGKCVIQDGATTITAERPLFSPDSIKLVVADGSGNPTTYTLDFDDTADQQPGPGATPADANPATADPASGGLDSADPANPATDATASTGPGATGATATGPDATGDVAAGNPAAGSDGATATPPNGQAAPNGTAAPANVTTPQSVWHGDGSVSGVLVPDQPGDAQLAMAPDDDQPQVGGMAGGGFPMGGGPAGGGGHDGGRPGSGWSVHGDLFDNAEPVYSMHGVLGDDDGMTD